MSNPLNQQVNDFVISSVFQICVLSQLHVRVRFMVCVFCNDTMRTSILICFGWSVSDGNLGERKAQTILQGIQRISEESQGHPAIYILSRTYGIEYTLVELLF